MGVWGRSVKAFAPALAVLLCACSSVFAQQSAPKPEAISIEPSVADFASLPTCDASRNTQVRTLDDTGVSVRCSDPGGGFVWRSQSISLPAFPEGEVTFGDSSGDLTSSDNFLVRSGVPSFEGDFGRWHSVRDAVEIQHGQIFASGVHYVRFTGDPTFVMAIGQGGSTIQSISGNSPTLNIVGAAPGYSIRDDGGGARYTCQVGVFVSGEKSCFRQATSGSPGVNYAHWDGGGFLGLGTTNPASRLHLLNGGITLQVSTEPATPAAGTSVMWLRDTAGQIDWVTKFDDGSNVVFSAKP